MSESRDPAIKLFGATIPVAAAAASPPEEEESEARGAEAPPAEGKKEAPKEAKDVEVNDVLPAEPDEANDTAEEPANSKVEENKAETDCSAPEKLKKPDKILPCPRCNSMETKFCYYNNYNVNQPRHFCKNCQRYWTAGGTMRNVPVGAGRRKSKHSSAHCRNLVIPSEGLQPAQLDTLNLTHHRVLPGGPSTPARPLLGNGTVLKFGQEVPLCESMASVLNIKDQDANADSGCAVRRESKEEPSCASSAAASNFRENESTANNAVRVNQSGTQVCSNGVGPVPPLQCYPGAPWAYPWSATWNNAAAAAAFALEAGKCSSGNSPGPGNGGNRSSVPWSAPAAMMAAAAAAPSLCAATMPFPFMPAPFWGFAAWPNGGAWNLPLVGSNGCISPSSSTSNSGCSGNSSPTLGKHSRDASSLQSEENSEKSLWVPKTLRIDDPEEAAKSSIWGTLGIKPDMGGIFQSKAENKAHKSDASAQVLHANPAALSRSQSFQETT